MNARLNAAQALSGDIGAGSLVVNDYRIQADAIDGGHRLTITRGSEVQTIDLMDGIGIAAIEKTGSTGDVDSYRITFTDGSTFDYTIETNAAAHAAAELERVAAENGRKAAETSRTDAELARESAETARAHAEDGRQSAEAARVTGEQNRASAESGRVAAENARVAAEDARVSAENTRAETFAGYENRIAESERTAQSVRDDADAGKFNGKDAPQESVLYTAQSLTEAQQVQARENVGAASAERVEAVEAALPGKLSEPAEGLAVGKYFRVAAIDANGHAVLEAVEAKDVGVQDVQVNGASIVADGVANVPMAALNSGVYGLVKLDSIYKSSLYVDKNTGALRVIDTGSFQIDNRSVYPITPRQLDYAVKAAMCDGKGAAWTADEQAAARERMGVDKQYELIEEITLTEKVSVVERSSEPNGTEYDFSDLTVFVYAPKSENAATYDCYITDSNNVNLIGVVSGIISPSNIKSSIFSFERHGGYIGVKSCTANSKSMLVLGNVITSPAAFGIANGSIKMMKLQIRNTYTEPLPIGTEIKIFGVRA